MARRYDKGGLHRPTQRYLLSGLLRCTHCGLNFWGAVLKLYHKGIDRRYYVDGGYRRYGLKVCKSTSIQAEALDRWVLGKVRGVILGDAEGTQAAVVAAATGRSWPARSAAPTRRPQKELAAVNKRIKATVAMLADPDLADLDELKATLVDLKRQREALEARKAHPSGEKGQCLDEASLRKWAREKLERLGEALGGKLPPLETRQLVHAYVDRLEVDPHKYTGTLFMVPDALALLEAESIRRVNFGSPSVPCLSSPPGATGSYWSLPMRRYEVTVLKSLTLRTAQMLRQVRSTEKNPSRRNLFDTFDRMPPMSMVEKPAWRPEPNANRRTPRLSRKLRPV
jgi:hypothetical protein